MRVAQATEFELVLGLRPPSAVAPRVLGALVMSEEDGLADYFIDLAVAVRGSGPPGR